MVYISAITGRLMSLSGATLRAVIPGANPSRPSLPVGWTGSIEVLYPAGCWEGKRLLPAFYGRSFTL